MAADSADRVNILDTLKNIERVLKAEEDQVIGMYSQINLNEGQVNASNAEAAGLTVIPEQHSTEMVATNGGGDAIAIAESPTAGFNPDRQPLDAGSAKPISPFAEQQD